MTRCLSKTGRCLSKTTVTRPPPIVGASDEDDKSDVEEISDVSLMEIVSSVSTVSVVDHVSTTRVDDTYRRIVVSTTLWVYDTYRYIDVSSREVTDEWLAKCQGNITSSIYTKQPPAREEVTHRGSWYETTNV